MLEEVHPNAGKLPEEVIVMPGTHTGNFGFQGPGQKVCPGDPEQRFVNCHDAEVGWEQVSTPNNFLAWDLATHVRHLGVLRLCFSFLENVLNLSCWISNRFGSDLPWSIAEVNVDANCSAPKAKA